MGVSWLFRVGQCPRLGDLPYPKENGHLVAERHPREWTLSYNVQVGVPR